MSGSKQAAKSIVNPPVGRRLFLVGSAALAGSLVIGFEAAPAQAASLRNAVGAGPAAQLGSWVRIAPDNRVTVLIAQSEMGQGVLTALSMLLAEELEVDWQLVAAEMAPSLPAYATKRGGRRVTGNSDSVTSFFEPMRRAGAAAREMLVAAAAARWLVPVEQCRARLGVVSHSASGRHATYGELVSAAAQLPVPQKPLLKDKSDWQLIGRSVPRVDIPAAVTGQSIFGTDVELPGLLTATIQACPTFGGRLAEVDEAPAMAIVGVRRVVRLKNAVAVVADGYWPALQGLKALQPEWDLSGIAAVNTAGIEQGLLEAFALPGVVGKSVGDAIKTLAAAGKLVAADYAVPYLAHACMEPMNATARVTADAAELWVPTQAQTDTEKAVGAAIGLDPTKVTVNTTMLGGGFGRRSYVDFAVQAAQIAQQLAGTPVKLIWSREEDLQHDFYRPGMAGRYRGSVNADGDPEALQVQLVGPSLTANFGLPPSLDGVINVMASSGDGYSIPNLHLTYQRVDVPVPIGIWRSVMLSQNGFFAESFIDELAHAGGVHSPLDMRRRMAAKSPQASRVLEKLAELIGAEKPGEPRRAWGMALIMGWNSCCGVAVDLSVSAAKTLTIHEFVCAIDCGIAVNPAIVLAQAEGGIFFGLSAALWGDVRFEDSQTVGGNFDVHRVLRFNEAPRMRVEVLKSDSAPGGVGEISTAAVAPAIANAIFLASGTRVRQLPFARAQFDLA